MWSLMHEGAPRPKSLFYPRLRRRIDDEAKIEQTFTAFKNILHAIVAWPLCNSGEAWRHGFSGHSGEFLAFVCPNQWMVVAAVTHSGRAF